MKLRTTVAFLLAATGALVGGVCAAQQAAPAAVPEVMPYDIPYGMPISLERAQALIGAAVGEAKRHNWKMNVALVDSGGNLVAFQRMDGAQLSSIAISQHKARAAAMFRRETKIFEEVMLLRHNTAVATLDGVVASRGGIPLVENGHLIGAIGCSGGTGEQDEVVCKVAVEALH